VSNETPGTAGSSAKPGAGGVQAESKHSVVPPPSAKPGAGGVRVESKHSIVAKTEPGTGRSGTQAVETKVTQTGQGAAVTEDAFKPGATERLEMACNELMVAVAQMRREDRKGAINLVLGAPASEWERFAPGRWIFLHHRQQPHQVYPGLCGDLNNLDHLTLVAEALAGQVDHVYFDHQAMKDLHWKAAHLRQIRTMLVPDTGVFHFPLGQCGNGKPVLQSYQPEGAPTAEGILASSSLGVAEDELPVEVLLPYNFNEFGKTLRTQATRLCQEERLHPAIFALLARCFDRVDEERDVPEFLSHHPERTAVQENFIACRAESKRR
jgi:hypothetical protein